jgi:hypothetical protein
MKDTPWTTALPLDISIFILLFVGYSTPYPLLLSVVIFALWALIILSFFFSTLSYIANRVYFQATAVLNSGTASVQEILDACKQLDWALPIRKALRKGAQKQASKMSSSFMLYHVLSDVAFWALLIYIEHPFLAIAKMVSFFVGTKEIMAARQVSNIGE